jgi:hypothetical protein
MRMPMRRFTRLTNAFSKKAENHIYALALYFTFYNFVRMHKTLKCSPAMAAGISNTLWGMEDVVALIDDRAEAPKKRAPYKTKARIAAEISNRDTTELFNALRYVIRYGIAWRAMPNDLSP